MALAQAALIAKPWERRPTETPEAWQAFATYRDMQMNERTFTKVAVAIQKSEQLVQRWARKFAWKIRAMEYDSHILDLQGIRSQNSRLEAAKRHSEAARNLVAKVGKRIDRLIPEEIDVAALPGFLRVGVEVERLALGESRDGGPGGGNSGTVVVAGADGSRIGVSWGNNSPNWLNSANEEMKRDSTSTLLPEGTRGKASAECADQGTKRAKVNSSNKLLKAADILNNANAAQKRAAVRAVTLKCKRKSPRAERSRKLIN